MTTSPHISQDEYEFYLKNHVRLAELDKTLVVTYGQITGALESQQASSPQQRTLHYTTMKWILGDNWLLKVLGSLKSMLPGDYLSSPRLMILGSLIGETIQFLEAPQVNGNTLYGVVNSDKLRKRLETISSAIGDIRMQAVDRLIATAGEKTV